MVDATRGQIDSKLRLPPPTSKLRFGPLKTSAPLVTYMLANEKPASPGQISPQWYPPTLRLGGVRPVAGPLDVSITNSINRSTW
ncbi:hypothetical protein N7537_005067 [Penicillium hordei]|uniref:Uncharacterized protein n=1 Tax=Penicillium hordei TaxID=40994 RepID=A0AAD6ECF8_9EURO|nr:uncharacterized protein N7537_005067 [Penicillium hordei]KAJ5608448.1 hypothetical protein N7537_005067 [Penicillium hordei]